MTFCLGLSLLSSCPPDRGPEKLDAFHALQSREAERILALLGSSPEQPGSASPGIIQKEPGGRPYFADHRGDFSISHSRRAVAVAFTAEQAPGGGTSSGVRAGCDIQYIDPKRNCDEIIDRFFLPEEGDYIRAAPDSSEGRRRFYGLWVLKEAYLKLRGLSIFEIKEAPVFTMGEAALPASPDSPYPLSLACHLYELGSSPGERYMLAVLRETGTFPGGAGEAPVQPPDVRWFSPETLPLRSMAAIKAMVRPVKTVSPKM